MPFKIIRNDITKMSADAIVNTANPEPIYAGGTDHAIYTAAGAGELLRERQKIGKIETGDAVSTPAFNLNARYIIHTVGPAWEGGDHGEKEAVKSCYENSLKLAKELNCNSIAFPLIATGVYGFPKADALKIAVSVFAEFLTKNDMDISLVVFDEASFVLSDKIFTGVDAFIDDNYVSEALEDEYRIDEHETDGYGLPTKAGIYSAHLSGSISDRERRKPKEREPKDREPKERKKKLRLFKKDTFMPPMGAAMSMSAPAEMAALKEDSAPTEMAVLKEDSAAKEIIELEETAAPMAMSEAMALIEPKKASGRTLEELMSHVGETWQESLFRLIDEKGYTDTEVYKRANVDRKLFSKIRSNASYQPKKITAVAFALALKLNLDETKDLLGRAGYALSPSSRFDLIIEYFIGQEVYDTYTINLALFKHDQPLLGE